MKRYLLANVGSNDVHLNSNEIRSCRESGKKIDEDFEKNRKDISLPILSKIIDKYNIDDIYLFVTDQDETVEEKYRINDTVYFGYIIKKIYPHSNLIKITKKPYDYTYMYSFYQEELLKLKEKVREDSVVYLSITGGIPAANTALLLQGVKTFGPLSQPVYVTQEKSESLDLNRVFQKEKTLENAILSISNYEYDSAISILENIGFDKNIMGMLKYLNYRKNFDFKNAYLELQSLSLIGDDKLLIDKLNYDLDNLKKENLEYKILEIFYHLKINYKKGQFLEFASLLYRFHDAYLRYMFELKTKINPPLKKNDKAKLDNFIKYIETTKPNLKTFLDNSTYNPNKGIIPKSYNQKNIDYFEPSRITFLAILYFWIDKENVSHLNSHLEALTCIDSIIDLRNNSIYGHGFEGISKEDIIRTHDEAKRKYPRKGSSNKRLTIWEDLEFLIKEIKSKTYGFDEVNSWLIEKMKRKL